MSSIEQAKRLIAASSREGARILGAGVSRPCYAGRYNAAAAAALEDGAAQLTPEERRLIASFIESESAETRDGTFQFRITSTERERIKAEAQAAGVDMSEYVRGRVFGE